MFNKFHSSLIEPQVRKKMFHHSHFILNFVSRRNINTRICIFPVKKFDIFGILFINYVYGITNFKSLKFHRMRWTQCEKYMHLQNFRWKI
jgi:hypothetical protein